MFGMVEMNTLALRTRLLRMNIQYFRVEDLLKIAGENTKTESTLFIAIL